MLAYAHRILDVTPAKLNDREHQNSQITSLNTRNIKESTVSMFIKSDTP